MLIRLGVYQLFGAPVAPLIQRQVSLYRERKKTRRMKDNLTSSGKGRAFRRKDGKYLIYLPKDLAEDSMFPFKTETSVKVKVPFNIGGKTLTIERYK